ncbi:25648_t:CDS:2, partial [Racocetra persica]
MESCTMLDSCNCSQCIDWNAPLCQLCFSNRCEIKSFPDYETYCASCIPRNHCLYHCNVKRDDDHVFEVPLNPKFLNEIECALQGREVITEYENEDLKNELYFFTGG